MIRAYLISRALVSILSRLTEPWFRRLKLKLVSKSKSIYKIIEVLTVEHCDGNALYSRPNIFSENSPKKYEIGEKDIEIKNLTVEPCKGNALYI